MKLEDQTDDDLRALVIAGNDDAFSAIYERYRGHFYGFLYSMRVPTQDIGPLVNTCFMKIYDNIEIINNIKSWGFTTCKRAYIDMYRKSKGKNSPVPLYDEDGSLGRLVDKSNAIKETPCDEAIDKEEATENKRLTGLAFDCIGRLKDAHRDTAMLFYKDGLTYAQIAKTLNIPIGSVMSRLYHARKKIAKEVRFITLKENKERQVKNEV
jgi:RNA polymerase sigma-70 factor (ECF subfamily)